MALTKIKLDSMITGTLPDANIPDNITITGAQTGITQVGTITAGTWQGTAIASAYLDADTAHLTTTQTFSGAKTFSADLTLSEDINLAVGKLVNFGDTSGTTDRMLIRKNDDGNGEINVLSNNGLILRTNDTTRLTIDSAGRVGIGVASPANKLTVVQTENATESNITQDSDTWGVLVETGNYTADRFVGMIAHRNANKEAQTGIWSEITSSGSLMHFGTSSDYDVGVNAKNMSLKYDGTVNFPGSVTSVGTLHVKNNSATSSGIEVGCGSGDFKLFTFNSTHSTNGAFASDSGTIDADDALSGGLSIMTRHSTATMRFYTGGYADGNKRLEIDHDGNATFNNDVTITSANNPALLMTSTEANTDNFKIYVGGTGLSFYNTTDSKAFHFKHDGDLSFGHDGATVNTKTWGNAEVTGNITASRISTKQDQKGTNVGTQNVMTPTNGTFGIAMACRDETEQSDYELCMWTKGQSGNGTVVDIKSSGETGFGFSGDVLQFTASSSRPWNISVTVMGSR